MATTVLHLTLDGHKLEGFDEILEKRRKVGNEAEFKAWQVEYDAWRWRHPLLGQFLPREVKFDLSQPGVLELVIENPRIPITPLGIELDHRFRTEVDDKSPSPSFNGVIWLVTRATLVHEFRSAVPLREGFIQNWMQERKVSVHVICEGESDMDLKYYKYKVRMETQLGGNVEVTDPCYRPILPGDHYQALSNAIQEVVGMVVRIDQGTATP